LCCYCSFIFIIHEVDGYKAQYRGGGGGLGKGEGKKQQQTTHVQ